LVEECLIKFMPIVIDGINLVQEDRDCEIRFIASGSSSSSDGSMGSSNESGMGSSNGGSSDCTSDSTVLFSTSTDTGSTASSTSSIAQPIVLPPPSTTQAGATSGSNGQAGNSATQDPITVSQTALGTSPTNSAISVVSVGEVPASDVQTFTPSPTVSGAAGATQAQDTAPSTSAAVQLPGKQLQVLPIGLGVFAGISVIALIVVGLVTYERTKYRRAFRQRRLAAAGAEMGYGGSGMSERR